jgi:DNA-directed RNA polymerase specialized sigma24 family protein
MSKFNIKHSAQRIDQYRDKIVRYLRKRVPGHCVEDFAQETMVNAYAYLSNGNTLDKPLAFLYRTANNVVRQNHRDQKTAAVTDTVANIDELECKVGTPSVEQTVMSELEYEAMCVAIGRRNLKQRLEPYVNRSQVGRSSQYPSTGTISRARRSRGNYNCILTSRRHSN